MLSTEKTIETYFAPAGRDAAEYLLAFRDDIRDSLFVESFIETIPLLAIVLNHKRQIIISNSKICTLFDLHPDAMIGMRPGELLQCEFSSEGPDGCGTGVHCQTCGAVGAIIESMDTRQRVTRECRLRRVGMQSLDLQITAYPFEINGRDIISLFIEDISDKKRREILEHTFFHDIMNTAGGITGLSQVLAEDIPPTTDQGQYAALLASQTRSLLEEIEYHRDLTYAESGDLNVSPQPVDIKTLLTEITGLYRTHQVARNRNIELHCSADVRITTDPRLLSRVIGNMIKNALEATPENHTVTVSATIQPQGVLLAVHNPTVMPDEVRLQVFQRSFSTKAGSGRGVGTHSMKLFGEKYLGGKVDFTSTEPQGTTFTIALPSM